jgi:hypothetical protein
MRVSKAIKKIVALGVGATMMGATILGATAADLNNYPNFFLDGGTFDGLIVVGAGGPDSLAAVDISSSMFYAGSGTGATTTTTVSGDAWRVATSSKFLEIANSNASDSSVDGENFNNINTFIGDEELGALADGTWATNEQNYDYQQFLFFNDTTVTSGIVKFTESDDDVTADHFYLANAEDIAQYKLEFTANAQSDVTDSAGSATTSGTYLNDFEDTKMTIMGNEYTVVQARRPTSTKTKSVKLVLMSGAVNDELQEGESGSYTVEGTDYDVELAFVDATSAKFKVNGELTNKLLDGDTYKLSDGNEIGVSEVLYQSYAGGIHSATFFLGAKKLELRDDDITVASGAYNVKQGSEDIDGTVVTITGTDDNTTFTISTIEVYISAEDDFFVPAGSNLKDVMIAADEEAEALFGGWNIEYHGLEDVETHDLRLKTSSSRRYDLTLFDGDNNAVDIPVAYAASATNVTMGKDSGAAARTSQKRLIVNESAPLLDGADGATLPDTSGPIAKDDYFIITGGTASDGSAKSYLLQYKGADKDTKTSPKIKFKNEGSGETLEYSVTSTDNGGAATTVATIKLGGYSFIVVNNSNTDSDDFQINVSLDGDSDFDGGQVDFIDYYGSQWKINNLNRNGSDADYSTNISINMTTPNGDDYDNIVPAEIDLLITATTGPELRTAQTGLSLLTPSGETEIAYGYTSMGTFVTFSSPSGDPNELTLSYPSKQRLPQLYVTSGSTSAATSTSGGSLARVAIPVTATKLHTEAVGDVGSRHMITVGGPCANTVTAAVMYTEQGTDVPADCGQDFNPGEARIVLYDTGDTVAMVVAGFSGDDTRRAGKVLAQTSRYDLSGSEVTVAGTTFLDMEVTKVG